MGSKPSTGRVKPPKTSQKEPNFSISSRNSCSSIGSLSSGFQSCSSTNPHHHDQLETDHVSEIAMSKPSAKQPLGQRPSVIVRSLEFKEEQEEERLEKEHMKKASGLKVVLQGFEDCAKALAEEGNRNEDAFQKLCSMLEAKVTKPFHTHGKDEQRLVMANKLAKVGFVKHVTEYYDFVMDDLDIVAVTGDFVDETRQQEDPAFKLILAIREILWNFSDSSHRFTEELSTTNIVSRLVVDLEKIYEDGLQQLEEEEEDIFAFSSSVGILHNCARNPDVDRERFREAGAVDGLYPFLQSSLVYVKMITLLALGNMIKEDQANNLHAGLDVFDFLIDAIRDATKSPDRKKHGFHLSELVDGLASLAQSDQNKRLIMMKSPLEMLEGILRSKNHLEVLAAIRLVWELAFLGENKQKILSNEKLKRILSDLRTNLNNDIKSAALGAWFVIYGKDERLEEVHQGRTVRRESQSQQDGRHIMFSYCWGDKEIVLKIYKMLKEDGLPIWIDINDMGSYVNVLDGMARAVEEAKVILICYSEKYKNSQNCRTEAEYAFTRQKQVIPLKLQRGYSPDGWLGAVLGAKLFIEFSPVKDFNTQVDQLRKQLPSFDSESVIPVITPQPAAVGSTSAPPGVMVRDWGRADVDKWIKTKNLSPKVKSLTPENLEFLYRVMTKAPETFYRWLEDKLLLKTLDELMRFDSAMRDLHPFM